jgi:hypothetical protein
LARRAAIARVVKPRGTSAIGGLQNVQKPKFPVFFNTLDIGQRIVPAHYIVLILVVAVAVHNISLTI